MASNARVFNDAAVERERTTTHDLLVGGIVGGILAGAAMMAWAALSAAAADISPARPLELVAATLFGRDALEGGAGILLSGALLWAAVSAALGLLYASVVPRDFPFVSCALIGISYSFVIIAIATTVVLPRVNPLMRSEMPEMGGAWVLAYVVFGIGLGFVPRLRRRILAHPT